MNVLSILLQQAEEAGEGVNVFSLSQNVSAWTVLIFLLLLAVLLKFAFPPILGYAAAREQRIQNALDEAKRLRTEAEQLLAQQREELVEAKRAAQQILVDARQAGDRARQDLLDQTRLQQEEMLARARQDIERDRERALESVRRDAVELALAAASKLLERRLGADEDRKLVADYLGRVAPQGEAAGVA